MHPVLVWQSPSNALLVLSCYIRLELQNGRLENVGGLLPILVQV